MLPPEAVEGTDLFPLRLPSIRTAAHLPRLPQAHLPPHLPPVLLPRPQLHLLVVVVVVEVVEVAAVLLEVVPVEGTYLAVVVVEVCDCCGWML